MYYNNRKEELKTILLLNKIEREDLIEKQQSVSFEGEKIKEEIEKNERKITSMEEEKQEILKKDDLSYSQRNNMQNIITQIIRARNEVSRLKSDMKKYEVEEQILEKKINILKEKENNLREQIEKISN